MIEIINLALENSPITKLLEFFFTTLSKTRIKECCLLQEEFTNLINEDIEAARSIEGGQTTFPYRLVIQTWFDTAINGAPPIYLSFEENKKKVSI